MKRPITVEDILGLILRDEIQKELNKDFINHLTTRAALESSPMIYPNEEVRAAHLKQLKRNEKWRDAMRKRILADPEWKHFLEA